MGFTLEGSAINEMGENGETIMGNTLCVLINSQFHEVNFKMPFHRTSEPWTLLFFTATGGMKMIGQVWQGGESFALEDHSLALFVLHKAKRREGFASLRRTPSKMIEKVWSTYLSPSNPT